MVKVEIEAHELRNGNIEKISLVTHGAIRQPFKILKTEEILDAKPEGLKKTLSNIFGADESAQPQVAALFVHKSVAKQWIPLIKKHGFRVDKDHASLEGDIIVLKQEGFTEECAGSVVALNPDVAVQLTHVSKFFDPFPASSSFADNVAAGSFYPGMYNAMDSLAETIFNVLNESETSEEAASEVAKQVKAFSSHITNLVTELPTTVFKMEQESLQKEFEGSNVSSSATQTIVTDKENDMSKTVLKEAASGDLDGLLDDAPAADAAIAKTDAKIEAIVADEVVKTDEVVKGDEGAPKTGGSPGNPVVDSTSDTGAVSLDEGGVPEGFRKEERVVKEFVDGKIIEKFAEFLINEANGDEIFVKFIDALTPAPAIDADTKYTDAENKLFAAMGVMVKSLKGIEDSIAKQSTRIDAVEKTADSAQETADNTVVMPSAADDLGNAIATLNGGINKSEAAPAATEVTDIFKGLLPGIEQNG